MNKPILYSLATVLFIVVTVLIGLFLVDINKVEDFSTPLEMQNSVESAALPKSSWIDVITGNKNDYFYPVTEINIDMDLKYSVDSKFRSRSRNFKLLTQKLDRYHFFCLKQVLDQSRIQHKLERFDNEIGVVLYSNDQKILKYVVEELKKYGIESQVKEIRN